MYPRNVGEGGEGGSLGRGAGSGGGGGGGGKPQIDVAAQGCSVGDEVGSPKPQVGIGDEVFSQKTQDGSFSIRQNQRVGSHLRLPRTYWISVCASELLVATAWAAYAA